MNWNDCEAVWKNQELVVGGDANLIALKDTLDTNSRKRSALQFARYLFRAGAALVAAVGMGYAWWGVGRTGWPMALSVVWAFGIAVTSVREGIRSYRTRLSPDVALLVKVETEIAELRRQRHLHLNVWIKDILPGVIVVGIASVTIVRHTDRGPMPPGFLTDLLTNPLTLAWIIVLTVSFGSFIWYGWRANRDEVLKQIDPRLKELERLRSQILVEE